MTVTRADIEAALGPCDEAARVGSPSGMGECWRIVQNGDVKAVKVITRNHEPERFEREVEAMRRINSPRVVRVLGRGELTTADDGEVCPYLLSDFLAGGDVRENMNAGWPDDQQLRAFALGVLEGVVELHKAHVVHRDLKPENLILLGGDWTHPVIIDLGLSRLIDLSTVTVYPWAGGSWPYMAPEQLQGERAFNRSDVWAVAVIAAELASQQHPYGWRGERNPPPDWDARLRAGLSIPGNRPAGLRDWLAQAGAYPGYRRPDADKAHDLLESLWP